MVLSKLNPSASVFEWANGKSRCKSHRFVCYCLIDVEVLSCRLSLVNVYDAIMHFGFVLLKFL